MTVEIYSHLSVDSNFAVAINCADASISVCRLKFRQLVTHGLAKSGGTMAWAHGSSDGKRAAVMSWCDVANIFWQEQPAMIAVDLKEKPRKKRHMCRIKSQRWHSATTMALRTEFLLKMPSEFLCSSGRASRPPSPSEHEQELLTGMRPCTRACVVTLLTPHCNVAQPYFGRNLILACSYVRSSASIP